ncbi:MAG: tetratricopeptide repeat protein, partial [Robiginitomaculum sp.]|nr:tetratricopeptide repeat protein [Robiginitomaculum sp.]
MINSTVTKFLLSSAALSVLTGCSLASLPGGYSPIEQQTVQELSTSNYTPRSADERAAILTQELFAQAAFWSREYDLNPADLEAAINLASTLRRLGNPRKSIEVAQTTRALYPRDADLMAELAAAHLADNNPKEALPIIDAALAQRPNTARLWSLKGAALDQFEQFTEARQQYSRGLSIAPNDPGIIANVGLSYALEGDPKTAEIWLRRAANMPGASEAVRQNLSLVLGLQNKFGEAEKWANRDLDAQATSNNMSYIRTLRGTSTPMANVQNPKGTPRFNAPQPAPKTYAPNPSAPKTYGAVKTNDQGPPRTAPVR